MTTSPRLTIGVPVYNGGSLLSEMLQSLVRQTFTDFEIVISDNASTDDTSEIALRFADGIGGFGTTATTPTLAPRRTSTGCFSWRTTVVISSGRDMMICTNRPTSRDA